MPLLWLSLAFLAGILLAASFVQPTTAWLILAAFAMLGALAVSIVKRWRNKASNVRPAMFNVRLSLSPPFLLLPLALFLGAARYQSALPLIDPSFIAWYNDLETTFIVEGVVVEPPDVRDTYTNLRVSVKKLHPQEDLLFQEAGGMLLAKVPTDETWHYGDCVRLEGQLQTPPQDEGFSYRDYLARQGIYSYMPRATALRTCHGRGNPILGLIYRIKEQSLATVYRLYPDPDASLLAGILLGVEAGIPQRVQEAFKATGTSHIIAISGFNISIIAGLFTTAFGRLLGPKRGAVLAIIGIFAYAVLVGASASVVRAAIMGCLSLIARQLGRRQAGLNTLGFTAAVMALLTPQTLWDVGFQLSFGATLGLILYADPLQNWFMGLLSRRLPQVVAQRIAGLVGNYFLFTLAAQVMTLPVMAYYFRRISFVALITNPVVLPCQPPLMIFGGLAVLLGMVWQPLGQWIAYLAWPFIAFTIRTVEFFAGLPGGTLVLGEVALPVVILIYLGILALTVMGCRFRERLRAVGPALPVMVLGLLTVSVWRTAYSAPDGRLHVTVFDVGSGDGILIQTPNGRNVLVDGGPSARQLSDALGRRLPPTRRELDWLVIAAAGDEQVTALPQVLDRYRPENVLWAGPTHGTRGARDLQEALIQAGIPQTLAEPGHVLDLGSGVELRVLTVGKRGAILLLEWECFRLLLPQGANFDDLEALKNGVAVGPVTALLLADGGYAPVNPPEWVANLRPQVGLLSVSPADRQELPSPETLELLQAYTILRTDRNGWIELTTDGQQVWVEVEKK